MATITATDVTDGFTEIAETTLDGSSDTFTFNASQSPLLILANNSGSTLTPVITGDGSTTITCDGVGPVDVSGGFSQAIANGETFAIRLNTRRGYLEGTIAIASGTGLVASLIV